MSKMREAPAVDTTDSQPSYVDRTIHDHHGSLLHPTVHDNDDAVSTMAPSEMGTSTIAPSSYAPSTIVEHKGLISGQERRRSSAGRWQSKTPSRKAFEGVCGAIDLVIPIEVNHDATSMHESGFAKLFQKIGSSSTGEQRRQSADLRPESLEQRRGSGEKKGPIVTEASSSR